MLINIRDHGALGEGDDTEVILRALADLRAGDQLLLGPRHRISAPLPVGNGSVSARSSEACFSVAGGGLPGFWAEGSWAGGTCLTWAGPVDPEAAMMVVQGPIVGLDLRNIHFDCAGAAGYGLVVKHAQRSRFSDIIVSGHTSAPYWLRAYQAAAETWNGCADNTWIQCSSTGPGSPTATGIRIGESSTEIVDPVTPTQLDVCRNTFINCWWACGPQGVGIDVGFADNLVFTGCTTYQGLGARFTAPSGPAGNMYPSEITFNHCSLSSGIECSGIHPSAGKLLFLPYQTGDGAAVPTLATAPTAAGFTTSGKFFGRWRGLPVTLHAGALAAAAAAAGPQVFGTDAEVVLASYDLQADTFSDGGGLLAIKATGRVWNYDPLARRVTLRARIGGLTGALVGEWVLDIPPSLPGAGWQLAADVHARYGGPSGVVVPGVGGAGLAGSPVVANTRAGLAVNVNTRALQPVVVTAQLSSPSANLQLGWSTFRVGYEAAP